VPCGEAKRQSPSISYVDIHSKLLLLTTGTLCVVQRTCQYEGDESKQRVAERKDEAGEYDVSNK